MQRGQRGSDSRRLRLVIDAKRRGGGGGGGYFSSRVAVSSMEELVLESRGAHDADSRGGKARSSVRFWRRRRRSKKKEEEEKGGGRRKNRGFEVRRTSASLLPSMKRKDLEDWGLWTDREVCVGTRGTGSKMEGREEEEEEEGREKLWKRARLGTRGEERRSREEGKFM